MKRILLFSTLTVAGGVLFVNLYNSIVDAPAWGADLPRSIATARAYYQTVNPGTFFRAVSPALQVLSLLSLVLHWKSHPSLRRYLGAAFLLFVGADAFTFGYFYPRNEIMFLTAKLTDVETLRQTWQEWSRMNYLRSAVVLAGVICTGLGLNGSYTRQPQSVFTVRPEPVR
ncbi:DUF1772 domain-containing protein [Larkinella soli]|uniref:DUF1772 domain-containing protein n=1 Tax=Larkinella soli TaxID=1770527 RepID=UPI0013E39279|nr:DUF1772 domain-containing protein [Larkinella soli]